MSWALAYGPLRSVRRPPLRLPIFASKRDHRGARVGLLGLESLTYCHFGLGLRIRNEFGLWDASSPLLRDCQASEGVQAGDIHPDDASMLILRALWVRLHH